MKRQETFSIRKLSIGAASVLLGTFLVAGQGQVVSANEQVDEVVTLAQATDDSDSQTTVLETIEIASPVTYVADETQEVGYHEVEVEGQAGQLIISETDGVTTAERIEPTASREVYGTKPEVVEEILEKATTEYVANDKLEAGQQVVKQEGVDGKKVTTTSYWVQVKEEVKKDLVGKSNTGYYNFDVKGVIRNDYSGKTTYIIDDSQGLPSDKVVIDIDKEAFENGLREALDTSSTKYVDGVSVEKTEEEKRVDYLRESLKHDVLVLATGEDSWQTFGPAGEDLSNYVQSYFIRQTSSADKYADVKAAYLRFQETLDYIYSTYQTKEELVQFIKDSGFVGLNWGYTYWTGQLTSESSSEPEYVYQLSQADAYGPSRTTLLRRYLAELDEAGIGYDVVDVDQVQIDGTVYKITYSSRFEPDPEKVWTDDEIIKKFEEWVDTYLVAYETQTKRYNNNQGFADDLNIVYESTQMFDEDKAWFTEQLSKLPTALKQTLVKVTVTDDALYSDAGRSIGVAYSANKQIKLEYPAMGSREKLLQVFLHELSHIIDFTGETSGRYISYSSVFSGLNSQTPVDNVYNRYFNRLITEDNVTVRAYYQDYIGESFAEFFGNYLLHRLYGYDYVKFIEIDGKVLTLYPYDNGGTPESIEENRENYLKYYNDPVAYSPVAEAEWFFDKLYNLLFEQPTTAEVVVDQITTEVIDVQQKIVEVGTKPQVVEQITTYTTIEREDADLLIGEKRVIQVGKDGIVKKTTRYELVDKITGEVVATTTSEVIQELVEEIIAVGTKVAEVVEPEVETPTEEPSVSEPEIEVPTEETTAIPTEAPVEENKPEAVIDTPTEEPSTTPEVTEEPSVDEPVSEPEVETPTDEVTAIPTESPVEEDKPEAVIEPTAEETATTPEVTEEPSSEEVVTEPVVEEEISAIPDYAPEEEALPEYVFDPADFQDVLEPSQEEVSDKESSNQAGGAAATASHDKPVISTLSGIGSADRPVITATASAPSYSRTARATAEKSLPNTGDSNALLSLVGFGLAAFGLVGRKRRRV